MARKTALLGSSVSPAFKRNMSNWRKREGTTKRELFHRMVASYKPKREGEAFFKLQRKIAPSTDGRSAD